MLRKRYRSAGFIAFARILAVRRRGSAQAGCATIIAWARRHDTGPCVRI
jgi:hypothetical protein